MSDCEEMNYMDTGEALDMLASLREVAQRVLEEE